MYALIENQKVIRVFETHFSAVENGYAKNRQIIETNKNHLFYLDGGAIVIGELAKCQSENYRKIGNFTQEWKIVTDECTYQLSEVDFWQPIGTWLSF